MDELELRLLVARALAEDLGLPPPSRPEDIGAGEGAIDLGRDVTSSSVVPEDATARASIVQKQPGIVFGIDAAREAFAQTGTNHFDPLLVEGQWREQVPAAVARVSGQGWALLAAERVALNLLGHLSGIATLTACFVRAVEGTGVRILDTRKTTPGLRSLEKAAVAAGGGTNHRLGLHDGVLIKENHAALAGGVGEAVRRARRAHPNNPIEAECGDLQEVQAALEAGARRLLLDNMGPDELRRAVQAARDANPRVELEASGGVTLDNVAALAAAGVDLISVGALTHSVPALDLSMSLEPG